MTQPQTALLSIRAGLDRSHAHPSVDRSGHQTLRCKALTSASSSIAKGLGCMRDFEERCPADFVFNDRTLRFRLTRELNIAFGPMQVTIGYDL
jgi:hypothetical protein